MCGLARVWFCQLAGRSAPSLPLETEVVTISVPTVREAGSSKSFFRSKAYATWTSPVRTIRFSTPADSAPASTRCREAG